MRFNVITANISADFLSPSGVPDWDDRKSLLVQALQDADPDLIALQEVTPPQLRFLREQLADFIALTVPVIDPDPALVSTWREAYAKFGLPELPDPYEIVLFYRANAFKSLASGYWWLSPTPARPSTGFGNIAPRAMQWARLLHWDSGRTLIYFNTHLDHRCTSSMVELCREKFTAFINPELLLIFAGDFNFNPAYPEYAALLADGWRDAHAELGAPEAATFLYDLPGMPSGRIDHILYRGAGIAPQSWNRLFSPDPQRRLSDHDPVHVRFRINQG